MDTKVVNRGTNGEYNPWDTAPKIERVYVRGLSPNSYGNAIGIGMADMVHDRLLDAVDWTPTSINGLTASGMACLRAPWHYADDRTCLDKLWRTVGKFEASEVRIGWIANSLEIGTLAMTENLRPELEKRDDIEIRGTGAEWPFATDGDLRSPFSAVGSRAF
jgi:hypothetical protein